MSRLAHVTLAIAGLIAPLAFAAAQLPYARDYPAIGYADGAPGDAIARLQARLESGDVALRFDGRGGWLAALLEALDIDVASQMLVYSQTSLQSGRISPAAPRAIYFNDDLYVAWVQDGLIEIASVDAELGVVFYSLAQEPAAPRFERHTVQCLQCHDSYSLGGGGVPRLLVGSGYTTEAGALASHEGWILTDDRTPVRRRWGGWYVTGTHGRQVHLGNVIVPADGSGGRPAAAGNLTDLSALLDVSPYLSPHSDIVALMVLEHQIRVHNAIIRVGWDVRQALHEERVRNREAGRDEDALADATRTRIAAMTEPLVRALLLVDEAQLTAPIRGTSGFAERFTARGPFDASGRSLRELDLSRRLFRYPCSYLIYSEAFGALPEIARAFVYRRLDEVLGGRDDSGAFAHLSDDDRTSIRAILRATHPGFAGG